MAYDPLYVAFLYYFNVERDYFECHEVMEELWLEEGRDLLCQGLLQVAVGLFHARNDNVSGAIKLFTQALDKLRRYPEHTLGIDLGKLIRDSDQYVEKLEQHNGGTPYPFEDMTIAILDPTLQEAVDAVEAAEKQHS